MVRPEDDTLALATLYSGFVGQLEQDPHGAAHDSFDGPINTIDTAARDPLFFFLHANVDRLWAKWQLLNNGFDAGTDAGYLPQGHGQRTNDPHPPDERIGHCVQDTMWPWNGDTASPRPESAPGGTLASASMTDAPGPSPTVGDMIDYQGVLSPLHRLAFDYEDVPFKFQTI